MKYLLLACIILATATISFNGKTCGNGFDAISLKYFKGYETANTDENNLQLASKGGDTSGLSYEFKLNYVDDFKVIFNISIGANAKGESSIIDGIAVTLSQDEKTSFPRNSGGSMGTFLAVKNAVIFALDLFYNKEGNDISAKSLDIHECLDGSTCVAMENSKSSQVDLKSVGDYLLYY